MNRPTFICPDCRRPVARVFQRPDGGFACDACTPKARSGACGKKRYANEAEAERELEIAKLRLAQGDVTRLEFRTYYCEVCGAWHLTKQSTGREAA